MLLGALQRLGLLMPPFERSLWVVTASAQSLETALPAIDRAALQRPGYPVVLSATTPSAGPAVRRLEGSEYLVPAPLLGFAGLGALTRLLRALRPVAVLLLDPLPRLRRRLERRGVPLLAWQPDRQDVAKLEAMLLAALPSLADPAARLSYRRTHWSLRLCRSRPAQLLAALLGHRRLADWPALRQRLGQPKAILCLGNGPSSAGLDPAAAAGACLFRVNWIWRAWDGASAPDLVVVGNTRLPRRGAKPVLVFYQGEEATYTFLRQLLRGHLRRFDYLIMTEQDSPLTRRTWPARPSGGVTMVAVAAALGPERLAVAGIDLYRHAEGRYPAGPAQRNAYARAHDRDTEVAMIALLLASHRGQLTVHGEPLRQALADRGRVA